MNNIQKRFILFLIGCIGTRSAIAYAAKAVKPDLLRWMGFLAVLPVLGWLYIIITGSRKTGAEVFGDKIWWGDLRIVHATLYTLFAYYAINKDAGAWKFLAIDVVIALLAFLWHHGSAGNFARLI
jgi:hypothetical protein